MTDKEFDIFEHTADVGIRLKRPELSSLFRDAAFAMFHIIAPDVQAAPLFEKNFTVAGGDLEELMVNWLSELNFLFQTELFIPVKIEIDIQNFDAAVRIVGGVGDAKNHNIEIEIKAVTYHKLYVKKDKNEWATQVIFDI